MLSFPLSLGLFGDWGSGKSFFMRQLEKTIDEVAKIASPGYCTQIVQIRFNAWNYIDTQNLWASLTSEIFEQLAQKISSGDTATAAMKRAQLLAATDSSRNVLAEAQTKKESVELSLHQSEERLKQLANTDADLRAVLRDVKLPRTTVQSIMESTGLRKQAEEISAKLLLPINEATPESVGQQLAELRTTSGRIRASWRSLWASPPGERRRLLVILLVCLGTPLLATQVAPFFTHAWKAVSGLFGVAGLVGLGVKLQPFLAAAKAAAKQLETAWNAANAQLEAQKQLQRDTLEKERTALANQMEQAQKSVDVATTALRYAEAQLDALRADRQVSDFIRQRNQSKDYTQHLGVIARAHQDFARLTKLLKEAQTERSRDSQEPPSPLPHIDRIILYIDDLDRCPEDKVVDVLQAVHLLLAFELFVVVVGVDSRWLLHSLQQHSAVFQSSLRKDIHMSNEERHHWQSTPLNYLEKIFQIPYALRVMDPQGFGSLIDDLTRATAIPAPNPTPQQLPALRTDAPEELAAQLDPKHYSSPEPVKTGDSEPTAPPAPLILSITDEERSFMKALHELIPSPRSAKRFVNTYRLLHASLPANERATFIGSLERPGECQVAQLLLALIIGYPAEATTVLESLVEQEPTGAWWPFLMALPSTGHGASPDRWEELRSRMEEIQEEGILPTDLSCIPFVKWAPRVARFSFQARSVLLARRKRAPPTRIPAISDVARNT